MSEPAPELVTVEALLRIPIDETKQVELLAGVVYSSPRPRPRHARGVLALCRYLGGPFDLDRDGPGGWWILPEALIRWTPYDATSPDVSGWRKERVPIYPDALPIEIVPDWACEILSPSTAVRDRTVKMELYARHGVGHLWVVDPIVRTVEAFRNDDGQWLRLGAWGDGDHTEIAPFEGVKLDVGALFPPKDGPLFAADEADAPYRPDGAYAGG